MTSYLWNSAGVLIGTPGVNTASGTFDVQGAYYLGRGAAPGAAMQGTVDQAYGWEDQALTQAQLQDVVDAIVGGSGPDDLVGVGQPAYGASLATDGVITGAYDAAAPTVLYPEAGSGDAVTAEYA